MDPKQPEPRLGREEIPTQEMALPARRVVVTDRAKAPERPADDAGISASGASRVVPSPMTRGELLIPRNAAEQSQISDQASRVTMSEERRQSTNRSASDIRSVVQENEKAHGYVKALAGKIATRLNEEIEKGNATGAFMIAIGIAGLKDFLDFFEDGILALIQALPGVGQVTLAVIEFGYGAFSLLVSTTIFLFMLGKGWMIRSRVRIIYWVLTSLEIIPLLGFVPWQTLGVLYAWRLVVKRAEKAKDQQKVVKKMSSAQLKNLDANFEEILESSN